MPNSQAYFYYRSYCDKDIDGYSISGDFDDTDNAIDRNKSTLSQTNGYDTDGLSADFEVDLQYNRDIDTIVLKSNLKTFTIYFWDETATGTGEGDWVELQSYSTNTSEFLLYEFTEVAGSKIKISATHTITANEEKKIYMLEITKAITNMYIEDIKIVKAWEKINMTNIYGGDVQVVKYPNYGKINIKLNWGNLVGSDYIAYNTLKNSFIIDSINCYLYFSDTYDLLGEEAYYLMNDTSDYEASPSSPAMSSGVNGEMDLKEC